MLVLLLVLLVVARGALVVSLADVFFCEEEGAKGEAAKALIDGLGIPRWQLVVTEATGRTTPPRPASRPTR